MNTPHDETCAPVIERLILALCDSPRAVELTARTAPGRVQWSFRVDANDMPRIMGTYKRHLRALKLVVEMMGDCARETWLIDEQEPSGQRRDSVDAPPPAHHSAAQDAETLQQVLSVIGILSAVSVERESATKFNLNVKLSDPKDRLALMEKREALYESVPMDREPLHLLGALGPLFRTIARRQGVRYHIELSPP